MAFGGLSNWFKSNAGKAFDQVNMFDDGKSFKTRETDVMKKRKETNLKIAQLEKQAYQRAAPNQKSAVLARIAQNNKVNEQKKRSGVNSFLDSAATNIIYNNPLSVYAYKNWYDQGREFAGTLLGNKELQQSGTNALKGRRDLEAFNYEQAGNKTASVAGGATAGVLNALTPLPIPTRASATMPNFKIGSGVTNSTRILQNPVSRTVIAGGRYGLGSASDTSHAIREAGGSQNAQRIGGLTTGIVGTVLGSYGLGKLSDPPVNTLLKGGAMAAIRQANRAGIGEAAEELVEYGVDDAVARATYDPNRSIRQSVQNALTAAGTGYLGGAIARGATDVAGRYEGDKGGQQFKDDVNKVNHGKIVTEQGDLKTERTQVVEQMKNDFVNNKEGYNKGVKRLAEIDKRLSYLDKMEKITRNRIGNSLEIVNDENDANNGDTSKTNAPETDLENPTSTDNIPQGKVDPIADALGVDPNQKTELPETTEIPQAETKRNVRSEATGDIMNVVQKYTGVNPMADSELETSNRDGFIKGTRDELKKTNVLRIANDAASKGLEKMSRGGTVARGARRVAQYLAKNAGQDPEIVKAAQRFAGENSYTDSALLDYGQKVYELLPNPESRTRVHSVLDPEGAGVDASKIKLSKQEQQAAQQLRELGDAINDTSYRTGFISKKKWQENQNGKYIARLYHEVANSEDVTDFLELPDIRGLHLGMYKSRTDMNNDMRQRLIKDPVKLAVIRARQVRQNEVLMDYMRTAESKGYVRNTPTDGFVKVTPGNRMANWSGKYVRQDVYENVEGFKSMYAGVNALNNVLDVYDGNPLRRVRKKLLTIFNPVVRTGNVTSNYFFAYLNGVNPATYQKNKFWAKNAMKTNDPLYIQAEKAGLIGNSVILSDKNLFNARKEFLSAVERESNKGVWNNVKRANDRVTQRYGEADDIAKLSALKSHVDRGYSVNEAIEMTRKGFQDYSRVGHLYDLSAKAPIFGNAFVRFQGDLYMNIMKNAAVDHPLRVASLPLAALVLGNALSALAGETPEEKEARETRPGAPTIPFSRLVPGIDRNISLEFQIPDGKGGSRGAFDAARYTPLYLRQGVEGDSTVADASRILPFNIPESTSKNDVIRAAASDPLIGPIISIVGDTDWRGKSVRDPDGKRDGKELFPDDPLSGSEQARNVLQYLTRSYAPYPFNETGDIMAAVNQDKRNEQSEDGGKDDPSKPGYTPLFDREGYNTSGSKKSVLQSIGRLVGVRAEKFGKEEAENQIERNEMFDYFDKVDEFKDTLDSETRSQFEARHKGTQTRTGINEEFENDPWWKYNNATELLNNPKLFEAEREYAKLQNENNGRPIDPIYTLLNDSQVKMVLAKKTKLPGAKDEGFNTLYDEEWYQDFRVAQDAYYKAKDEWNKEQGYETYQSDNPYPEAGKDLQEAMNFYFELEDSGDKKRFRNQNPQLWEQMKAHWKATDDWEDREREKLGLPAIPREDYDDKSKYGSGYGSGGSKSNQLRNIAIGNNTPQAGLFKISAPPSVSLPKIGIKSIPRAVRIKRG